MKRQQPLRGGEYEGGVGAPVAHPRGKSPANGRLPALLPCLQPRNPFKKKHHSDIYSEKHVGAVGSRIIKIFSPGSSLQNYPNNPEPLGDAVGLWLVPRLCSPTRLAGGTVGPWLVPRFYPPPIPHTGKCSGPLECWFAHQGPKLSGSQKRCKQRADAR